MKPLLITLLALTCVMGVCSRRDYPNDERGLEPTKTGGFILSLADGIGIYFTNRDSGIVVTKHMTDMFGNVMVVFDGDTVTFSPRKQKELVVEKSKPHTKRKPLLSNNGSFGFGSIESVDYGGDIPSGFTITGEDDNFQSISFPPLKDTTIPSINKWTVEWLGADTSFHGFQLFGEPSAIYVTVATDSTTHKYKIDSNQNISHTIDYTRLQKITSVGKLLFITTTDTFHKALSLHSVTTDGEHITLIVKGVDGNYWANYRAEKYAFGENDFTILPNFK